MYLSKEVKIITQLRAEMRLREKEMEMQFNNKLHEKDMHFIKQLHEKDLKLEALRNEYARANWKHLKRETSLNAKTVLELFEQKRLGSENTREVRYKVFAENPDNLIEIEAWNFTPAAFATAAASFYKRICQAADPAFRSGDILAIPANALIESEWRVLGLIWKLFPFPAGKLIKCNIDGSATMVDELKDVVKEEVPELDDQSTPQSTNMQTSTEAGTESNSALEGEAPKYVAGLLAVCNHCGFRSENFTRCLRCNYKLPNDVQTRALNGTTKRIHDALKALASAPEGTLILRKRPDGPNKHTVNLIRKKAKVVVTVSSGEEDADDERSNSKLSETVQSIKRLCNVKHNNKEEPSISGIQQNSNDWTKQV